MGQHVGGAKIKKTNLQQGNTIAAKPMYAAGQRIAILARTKRVTITINYVVAESNNSYTYNVSYANGGCDMAESDIARLEISERQQ